MSPDHPRFRSLEIRERLVRGFRNGIVVPQGLIAQGRGEAFDYLLGEVTLRSARIATRAAAALLLAARNPVISVNGNVAALVSSDIVRLAHSVPAKLEVNLFHRNMPRERKIVSVLRRKGAGHVFGVDHRSSVLLRGVASQRSRVDSRGIGDADVVLIPLEDGDRSQALRSAGKSVIAIDLNPMSRTSLAATVTIVDNIVRAIPELVQATRTMKSLSRTRLTAMLSSFDNEKNLDRVMTEITRYMHGWART